MDRTKGSLRLEITLSEEDSMLRKIYKYLKEGRRKLSGILTIVRQIHMHTSLILTVIQGMENTMATQADLESLTARLNAGLDSLTTSIAGIRTDIEALKAANPGVDTTALEASVSRLETVTADALALDGENPGTETPDPGTETPTA